MIKKILFLLIFILLITSCTHEKDIFKIKREKKKDKNYEVIYPEFTGIDTEVITKLNKDIFAVANKSLDTWKYADERDKIKFKSTYKIEFEKEELISIRFDQVIKVNDGIRPYFEIKSITLNKSSGKKYNLSDLFYPHSGYEVILGNFIKDKINSENIDTIREFQGLDAEQEFYLTDNGLVIYYQPYVYTTRSYGPLIVEIPYLRIYKIIRKEYLNLVAEDIDRTLVEQCGMFKLN